MSYVEATAAALLAAGGTECAERFVIVDGDRAPELPGWTIKLGQAERQGVRVTMWRAFRAALEAGADQLIFCEDDVIPCRNAVRWMAQLVVPSDVAFVHFHDVRELPFATQPGLYRVPPNGGLGTGMCGNQCLLFPRRMLEWLARRDPLASGELKLPSRLIPAGVRNNADTLLGCLATKSLWPRLAIHLPRLVRHVGDDSAAHPTRPFIMETPNYPGDDFDALSLAGRPA